jgi:DNA-directed RNA polymerase subunit RPC12/RpoP
MFPATCSPSKARLHERRKTVVLEEVFMCLRCEADVYTNPMISGVQNRNHCPYCLCSRHLDYLIAGDRRSACKAVMQPIGLTVKPGRNKYVAKTFGELMLIHRCSECGKISINRLAADDQVEKLLELFYASLCVESSIRNQLTLNGIYILQADDWRIVVNQLHGSETI